jgi:2-aminoadipate transaminase
MHHALKQHFPAKSRWKKPRSGVFFWVELPNGVNTSKLLKYAIEVEQVAFIPGDAFRVANGRRATQCMRLNFSNLPVADIEKGITRLAQASKLAFA